MHNLWTSPERKKKLHENLLFMKNIFQSVKKFMHSETSRVLHNNVSCVDIKPTTFFIQILPTYRRHDKFILRIFFHQSHLSGERSCTLSNSFVIWPQPGGIWYEITLLVYTWTKLCEIAWLTDMTMSHSMQGVRLFSSFLVKKCCRKCSAFPVLGCTIKYIKSQYAPL